MELRRKTEIHEIEERKNQQINDLLRNHEKAFSDIKNYYNDITLNNLNLINTLKVNQINSSYNINHQFIFRMKLKRKNKKKNDWRNVWQNWKVKIEKCVNHWKRQEEKWKN
jgi:hypothetical protein